MVLTPSNEADDVSFYTCNFGLSVAVPYYLPIKYVITFLDGFECIHYISINTVYTERRQKLTDFWTHPPSADVIYGWPLTQRPTGTDGEKMD